MKMAHLRAKPSADTSAGALGRPFGEGGVGTRAPCQVPDLPGCGGKSPSGIACRRTPQELPHARRCCDRPAHRPSRAHCRGDDEVQHLRGELNAMLAFVEQLLEVDVAGVEPMTSVTPMAMKKRTDAVTDGEIADDILKNAPAAQDHFFLVPKVVE